MGLEKVKDAYNPLAVKVVKVDKEPAPGEREKRRRLTKWQDSEAVSSLSTCLKEHGDQGMKLYQLDDGRPALSFTPGLCKADVNTERWQIASMATELLIAAVDDLYLLIDAELLKLPRVLPAA